MGFASHRAFVERARRGIARAVGRFQFEDSGVAQRFNRAAWSDVRQLWVGIGEQVGGAAYVAWSRGMGDAWTRVFAGMPAQDPRGVCTVGGAGTGTSYCVVGTGGPGFVLTSVDGKVFVARVAPLGAPNLNAVGHDGNGHVIAVGDAMPGAGSWVQESDDDGITWFRVANPNAGGDLGLRAVIWTGQQWICTGDTGKILTSADRIVWTARASGTLTALHALAHDGRGNVVAAGAEAVMSRDHGVTWRGPFQIPRVNNVERGAIWSGRQWLICGRMVYGATSAAAIWTSRNGETWALVRNVTRNAGDFLMHVERGQLDHREILCVGGVINANNMVQRTRGLF